MNELYASNQELSSQVEDLTLNVFCVKEAEARLKDLTHDQNLNVQNLVQLVHENQRVIDEKKKIMRQDCVATLIDLILQADRDDSGKFGKPQGPVTSTSP